MDKKLADAVAVVVAAHNSKYAVVIDQDLAGRDKWYVVIMPNDPSEGVAEVDSTTGLMEWLQEHLTD